MACQQLVFMDCPATRLKRAFWLCSFLVERNSGQPGQWFNVPSAVSGTKNGFVFLLMMFVVCDKNKEINIPS